MKYSECSKHKQQKESILLCQQQKKTKINFWGYNHIIILREDGEKKKRY